MLYTGKGDTGTTKLFGCTERIAKSEARVHALGMIDELNSWLGLCRALADERGEKTVAATLCEIQNDLFTIQAALAGAPKVLDPEKLVWLEKIIAEIEVQLEPIHSFTIPGSTLLGGALDVGRTITRRAERHCVALEEFPERASIIPYLNRLSSVLFALARLAARRAGVRELSPTY